MLYSIFSLFIGFSMAGQEPTTASEVIQKVFSCQSRHSMFDTDFQQGSEVYLDILYHLSTRQVEVSYWPSDGPRFSLYPAAANFRSAYHNKSSVVLQWKTPEWETYVSMQYLGGPWGLATEVPEAYENVDYAGDDIEIWCEETEYTSPFLKQIEK